MRAGEQIKEARIQKGMTQQELATLAKTNVRTIQRIENGDVTARYYTLKVIATVLELDLALLMERDLGEPTDTRENRWLVVMLHLSGFLLLPTIMIWLFEKDRIRDIREHGVDVINFQLTMLVFLIPVLPLGGVPVLIALFTTAVILINTFKVIYNRPYHYPMTISFLKS